MARPSLVWADWVQVKCEYLHVGPLEMRFGYFHLNLDIHFGLLCINGMLAWFGGGLLAPATHNLASAPSVPDNGINTNPPLLLLMTDGNL